MSDLLSRLRRESKRYPRLTAEEERDLGVAALAGDRAARDRLVRHHLWVVVRIAKKYTVVERVLEEILQEGCLGLVLASTRFDPSKGVPFAVFATMRVRGQIQDYFRVGGVVRFSHRRDNPRRGEKPRVVSIDVSPDEPAAVIEIADPSPTADALLCDGNMDEAVDAVLSEFGRRLRSEVERDVWRRRFVADRPEVQGLIGADHGLSDGRISQIEKSLRERFRNFMLRRAMEAA